MKHTTHSIGEGSARVWLIDAQTIGCKLRGYITEPIAREAMRKTKQFCSEPQRQGVKPSLVLDISDVHGQSSGARSAAKEIGSFPLAKIAIFGGGRLLNTVAQYIVRAGSMRNYAKLFRIEAQAMDWLHNKQRPERAAGVKLRVVLTLIIIGISAATIAGWFIGSTELKIIVDSLKPMNPVSACTFIVAAVALLLLSRGAIGKYRKLAAGTLGTVVLLVGITVLLQRWLHLSGSLDELFFKSSLEQSSLTGRMSPLSALGFVLCGGMILTVLTGQRKRWQLYGFYVLSVTMFFIAAVSLIRAGLAPDSAYNLGMAMPMSLRSAICFLFLNHALQTVNRPVPFFEQGKRGFDAYWPAIIVCFVIVLVTSAAWRQTRSDGVQRVNTLVAKQLDETQNTIVDRTTAYINALRGYKAFFESSDKVTVDEFHNYFVSSQLLENYPGFSAITFAPNVAAKDKQSFIAQVRKEAGATHTSYKTYAIHPATSNDPLFPVQYSEPTTSGSGFDLSTDVERRKTLEEARDSGKAVATGTINLNASQGPKAPLRPGFFIAMPVYRQNNDGNKLDTVAERQARNIGFINAVFEDKQLFSDVFHQSGSNNDIRVVIKNAEDGTSMYTHNPNVAAGITQSHQQREMLVAGEKWNIALFTAPSFGYEGTARTLPWIVLFSGVTLAVLSTWLIVSLSRRREQAVALADSMTEDLNNERNTAVATQHKDEAILTSIGDAVFAIDASGRITLFNQVTEKISGFTAAEALGKPYKEILNFVFEKTGKVNDSFVTQALAGHVASMKNHTVLIRKDGQRVPVADSAAPIRDTHGALLGVIIVFRDVSTEYALDRAKTEFVSLASHQLRTPLTAISWNTELLMGDDVGKLNKGQQERMTEIQAGTKRMIDLVNALLDASRLDLGKLANEDATQISLASVTDEVLAELGRGSHAAAPHVIKKFEAKTSPVLANPKLIRMIIQNLLSNAMKYTPKEGSITVTLRPVTAADKHATHLPGNEAAVLLSIADTGYGIPKVQQDKIFTKLFRADNVRVLDVEGTGLGLYIVEQVVTKLGGKIWFTSTESVGTTFYVVLPVKTHAWKKKAAA